MRERGNRRERDSRYGRGVCVREREETLLQKGKKKIDLKKTCNEFTVT